MTKQTKQAELPEQLIKDFLFDGTYKGLGDLSIMVSHIISAYNAGSAQATERERERVTAGVENLETYSRIVGSKRTEYVSKKDVLALLQQEKLGEGEK